MERKIVNNYGSFDVTFEKAKGATMWDSNGKKYIDFGSNLTTGRYCRIEVNGIHSEKKLIFGENVNIGDFVSIRCANHISIGNNVSIFFLMKSSHLLSN